MKNKYQEAYKEIKNCIADLRNEYGRNLLKSDKENLNLMKELVDKETPMKVVFVSNGSAIKSAHCPKCNGLIHFGFETYCCYCGTKISWEW